MTRFPRDVPKRKVIKALEALGFEIIREGNHISMNQDKSRWKQNAPDYAEP